MPAFAASGARSACTAGGTANATASQPSSSSSNARPPLLRARRSPGCLGAPRPHRGQPCLGTGGEHARVDGPCPGPGTDQPDLHRTGHGCAASVSIAVTEELLVLAPGAGWGNSITGTGLSTRGCGAPPAGGPAGERSWPSLSFITSDTELFSIRGIRELSRGTGRRPGRSAATDPAATAQGHDRAAAARRGGRAAAAGRGPPRHRCVGGRQGALPGGQFGLDTGQPTGPGRAIRTARRTRPTGGRHACCPHRRRTRDCATRRERRTALVRRQVARLDEAERAALEAALPALRKLAANLHEEAEET